MQNVLYRTPKKDDLFLAFFLLVLHNAAESTEYIQCFIGAIWYISINSYTYTCMCILKFYLHVWWTEYTLPSDSYLPLPGACEYVTSMVKKTLQIWGIKVRIGDTIFLDYLSGPNIITSILLRIRQLSQLVLEARTQSCSDAKKQLGVKKYRSTGRTGKDKETIFPSSIKRECNPIDTVIGDFWLSEL